MFDRIVGTNSARKTRIKELFCLHPLQIRALLELAWDTRVHKNTEVGRPDRRSEMAELPKFFVDAILKESNSDNAAVNRRSFGCKSRWDHLIYAYLVENTSVLNIFRTVLFEHLHGEKLGVPANDEAQFWLRNTEELFYSNPAPFSIYNVVSDIRPNLEATRRNSYFRMFGMDLNHGDRKGKSFDFVKPESSNRDFVSTFEDFLREVWVGIVNTTNTSGVKRTDDSGIASLGRQLHDMLNDRRKNGNISREEFFAVSMMSWFHLTLEFDSPIITSLRAEGIREDQRLYRVAERVGAPAHAKTYDFFQLAKPMSRILTMLEQGRFTQEGDIPALFKFNNIANPIEEDMRTIISHWGYATGRDMKVRRGENVSIATSNYRGYTPSLPVNNVQEKEFSF